MIYNVYADELRDGFDTLLPDMQQRTGRFSEIVFSCKPLSHKGKFF
ncbi:MAG: hypothetical protein R8K20_04610 [Gallionellaceae bacterium]